MNETDNVLLRAEFDRHAINATDNPLGFVFNEMQAIVDRGVPIEHQLELTAASKIVVTVTVE